MKQLQVLDCRVLVRFGVTEDGYLIEEAPLEVKIARLDPDLFAQALQVILDRKAQTEALLAPQEVA